MSINIRVIANDKLDQIVTTFHYQHLSWECSICMLSFGKVENPTKEDCGHVFHEKGEPVRVKGARN